ncbi:MAG TPA: glycosyltransferase family 2 protein [Bryobacteraceae bacterium]|nr:glycosyltransferase family 2 protein [Bryobacteraceae bacterium]
MGVEPQAVVVIPTLSADFTLSECLGCLARQRYAAFQTIVVDNSGKGLVNKLGSLPLQVQVIENEQNVGFGAAINQGWRATRSEYVVSLNDDALPSPEWLESLVGAVESAPARVGMAASAIRLLGEGQLDSAGMLIASDGSSKQRGHGKEQSEYPDLEEVLLPSGAAALYRRGMLQQIGGFDDDFFLYCEDTDVGLRARWAGWSCLYVPGAVVEHRYSHSAGRASAMKAYYVERNRLYVVVKNFPATAVVKALPMYIVRYAWHLVFLVRGVGAASQYREGGSGVALAWFVMRAHLSVVWHLGSLLRKRRLNQRTATITSEEFTAALERFSLSVREVAAL